MEADPRHQRALDASVAWYDVLYALHRVGHRTDDGIWVASGPPPALHSAVKTLRPGLPVQRVLAAMAPFEHGSVADSFGDLDALADHGFTPFIDARWIAHDPGDPGPWPEGWWRVRSSDHLAVWTARHGTAHVLLQPLLADPAFTVMTRGPFEAGVVLHRPGQAMSISNVWGEVDWADLLALAAILTPGALVTGYEAGTELTRATAAGFVDLGPTRVWGR